MYGKSVKSDSSSKKGALKELRDSFSKEGMGSMHKVSVLAKDKKGLKKGLDKAKEVLGKMPKYSEEDGYEDKEHEEKDSSKYDDMSREELLEYIKKMM